MRHLTILTLILALLAVAMPVQAVDPTPPLPCPAAGPGAIINGVPACWTCVISNGLGIYGFSASDRTLVQIMNNPVNGVLTMPMIITPNKVYYDAGAPAPSPDGEQYAVCAWFAVR